jgi:serine/threonine-protein kinase
VTDNDALLAAAAAVADGAAVDWESVERAISNDEDRRLLAELRFIAEMTRALVSNASDSRKRDASEVEPDPAPIRSAGDIWGPLQIIEHVGRGTFGDVYRAWDRRLDREVALKILRRRERGDPRDASTVIQEGRLLARVRHPNVATVYGAERIDGHVGVWMEFVQGRTLEQELRTVGPFDADRVIRIGIELSGALSTVHRAGLIHGDVKAQNVLCDRDGRLVLTDFGAGSERRELRAGTSPDLAGTPITLAPELLQGHAATPLTDVYSLGILLYHLATGAYPISGQSLKDIRDAHARGHRIPLAVARPDLPRAFVRIIDRAVDPDPANRYESAESLGSALTSLTLAADQALTPRRSAAVWPWAAIGLVLVVSAAAAWMTWKSRGDGADQTLPSNAAVARLYLDGITSLDRGDARNARVLLEKVVAAEPGYGLGHSALSLALRNLGNLTKAREVAELAMQHVKGLRPAERLLVEGRYWMVHVQAAKAEEPFRTLFRLHPDNIDYGLQLAGCLGALNRSAEGLETIDALRRAQPRAETDFRVNILEAAMARNLGDLKRAQQAAAKAARRAADEADPRRTALARAEQGAIARVQGDLDRAREHYGAAAASFEVAGDQGRLAATRLSLGQLLWMHGDLTGARHAYESAAAIHRDLPSPSGEGVALQSLAHMLTAIGDLTGARQVYERMKARETGRSYATRLLIGPLAVRQGDPAVARAVLTDVLTEARQFKSKTAEGLALYGLAELAAARGDLVAALRQSDQGLTLFRQVRGEGLYVEPGIATSATILIAQGEFTAARRVLKEVETLTIPLNLGALHRTARFVSLQATLALEEDRAAEAEPLAKRAAELFQRDGYRDAEAAATELWARALRASGQSALADQAIVRAQSLAAKSEDVILRLTLSISAAVMTANSGAPGAGDSALRTLEAARRDAAAIGYRHLELQAALAAAAIQMKSGRRSQAVQRLAALEGEAARLGLGVIARKSARLRAPAPR